MQIWFEDRAVVLKHEETTKIVIADLHLGLHIGYEERIGVSFPAQYEVMLKRLKKLMIRSKAETLYILGDLKHSIGVNQKFNWQVIPEFIEELCEWVDVVVLPGNHDGGIRALLPRQVIVERIRGITLELGGINIGLLHGHTWPSEEVILASLILMGHNHPSVKIVKHIGHVVGGWRVEFLPVFLKTRLDKNCIRKILGYAPINENRMSVVIVLPSFNEIPSGVCVNQPSAKLRGPLFGRGCVELMSSEVYNVDGVLLGTVKELLVKSNEMIK